MMRLGGVNKLKYDLIDMTAAAFALIALAYGFLNIKKNGDGFVAVVSFIVALSILAWLYWN